MSGHYASRWLETPTHSLYPRLADLNSLPDGFPSSSNTSLAFINSLRFQASKSIRTSFIILASFNALVGLATAAGIYWDCYMTARRTDHKFQFKSSYWRLVGPAEIFPFLLSLSIFVQGIIFAAVQSFGLDSSLILGCASISQIMLPAFFMVPFLQMAFGLEATFQAIRPRNPFSPRHKWSVVTCVTVSSLALLVAYVVTRFMLPSNFCFASLVFFLKRYGVGSFAMLVTMAVTLLLGSVASFFRLYQVSGIGEQQRITATWMSWFMALAAVTMAIMAPFFKVVSGDDASDLGALQSQLSMVTVVVANLTGLNNGGLYVLLRTSRLGRFGPKGYHEFDSRRLNRHPRGFIFTKQMEQPISYPTPLAAPQGSLKSSFSDIESPTDAAAAIHPFIGVATSTNDFSTSQPFGNPKHTRKNSYNIFPRDNQSGPKPAVVLPPAVYSPTSPGKGPVLKNPFADEMLLPPTMPFADGRHTRNSSVDSSATVPIALRLSDINDMPPTQSFYQVSPISKAQRPTLTVPQPPMPSTSFSMEAKQEANKQLPPVPLALQKKPEEAKEGAEEQLRLSPTVYSPQEDSNKGKSKTAGSVTSPPPGRRWSPEASPRGNQTEWI